MYLIENKGGIEINKKIVFGSVFVLLLLSLSPCISAIEFNQLNPELSAISTASQRKDLFSEIETSNPFISPRLIDILEKHDTPLGYLLEMIANFFIFLGEISFPFSMFKIIPVLLQTFGILVYYIGFVTGQIIFDSSYIP